MVYQMIFLSIMTLATFTHCFPSKFIPENFEGKRIEFGSGGGITGAVTTFALLENGNLYTKKGIKDTFALLKTIDKDKTSQIFLNYNVLKINEINHNIPGNIYKFVNYYDKQGEHMITWVGKSEYNQLNLFYDNLRAICQLNND